MQPINHVIVLSFLSSNFQIQTQQSQLLVKSSEANVSCILYLDSCIIWFHAMYSSPEVNFDFCPSSLLASSIMH
jgi:hypothetical protein